MHDIICPHCHKAFKTLPALNAHLRSPAHADLLYRCPTALGGCGTEFRALSAFCQHMENSACRGARFRCMIEDYVKEIPETKRQLGYKVCRYLSCGGRVNQASGL